MAATEGAKAGIWANQLLEELEEDTGPVMVFIDNDSAERMIRQKRETDRSRHIEIKNQWLKEKHEDGIITTHHISGKENPADHLTKAKTQQELEWLREMVDPTVERGGVSIPSSSIGMRAHLSADNSTSPERS